MAITVLTFAPNINPAPAGLGGLATITVNWQIADLDGWLEYVNSPEISLSQTDATTVLLAAITVGFADTDITASYITRSFTITAPSVPIWYYVTIEDPGQTGDLVGTTLNAYCETDNTKAGQAGYVYAGAILCTPTAAGTIPLPGGWPTPVKILAQD